MVQMSLVYVMDWAGSLRIVTLMMGSWTDSFTALTVVTLLIQIGRLDPSCFPKTLGLTETGL